MNLKIIQSLDFFREPHGVMCKQNKLEGLIPVTRKNECWQPESSEVGFISGRFWLARTDVLLLNTSQYNTRNHWKYTLKKYTGKQNITALGFECERWDDERYQSHRYKPVRANHNYCRDPSGLNGKPWCYVKSNQKWDYCPVDFCYDHDGERLEFNLFLKKLAKVRNKQIIPNSFVPKSAHSDGQW